MVPSHAPDHVTTLKWSRGGRWGAAGDVGDRPRLAAGRPGRVLNVSGAGPGVRDLSKCLGLQQGKKSLETHSVGMSQNQSQN